MSREEMIDRAVVEAILDAPLRELRPRMIGRPPEFAPAFFARVRREFAALPHQGEG